MTDIEKLIKLIRKGIDYYFTESTEPPIENYLADYLLANRVVVMPCKVGDTLYVISQLKDKRILPFINTYNVSSIEFGRKKWKVYIMQEGGFIKIISQDEFGKTVFLSREEAEKALAEREK